MAALSRENRLWIAWLLGVAGAVAVIAAQFMDYTGFAIGSGGVESANEVAPRPIEFSAGTGSDQLWIPLIGGLAALACLYFARAGQWRLGRMLAAIGVITLLMSLVILLPNATDGGAGISGEPGEIGLAYAGVEEKLLRGFWFQLSGSVAMIGSGVAMVRLGQRA